MARPVGVCWLALAGNLFLFVFIFVFFFVFSFVFLFEEEWRDLLGLLAGFGWQPVW